MYSVYWKVFKSDFASKIKTNYITTNYINYTNVAVPILYRLNLPVPAKLHRNRNQTVWNRSGLFPYEKGNFQTFFSITNPESDYSDNCSSEEVNENAPTDYEAVTNSNTLRYLLACDPYRRDLSLF